VSQVRLVNEDGSVEGVMATRDARILAEQRGLDLVEVSPNADPPVCRIMDFGKFRYDESRKEKMARKNAVHHVVKEVKFHANVADHDYATKISHIKDFIAKGHKVKITLTFRGRENVHREIGFDLVNRLIKEVESVAIAEQPPRLMGRNLMALLAQKPSK
jgi:translation initiation factor IF-3